MKKSGSVNDSVRKGLVLEGGAMRGLFTAGITDVMMEQGLLPDGVIGVSAGAAFGCNIKSAQPGRVIRYSKTFASDPRYSGKQSLLRTGNIFNAEFAYHTVPEEYDLFDKEAFDNSPMEFHLVVTDIVNGKSVYRKCEKAGHEFYEWIRASTALPIVSRIVRLRGKKYLDGGITDSIPLEYFESLGYDRNIVILTQPEGYRKSPSSIMPLIRMVYRKYPEMVKAMERRHEMYNAQLDYIEKAEKEGRCLVIRPERSLPIGHISHDPREMQIIYEYGRRAGRRNIEAMKQFWSPKK